MKQKILRLFSFFLLLLPLCVILFGAGCEKDDETICACGIENPLENNEWLRPMVIQRSCVEVYTIRFEGNEYIVVSDCPEMADGMTIFYDCQGNKVCEWGGISLGGNCNMPTGFTYEYYEKNKKLIFKQ